MIETLHIIPSEARFMFGSYRDFSWWLTSRQKYVNFDTCRGVLTDAEGHPLTLLYLSNIQEWLNWSLDGRT